MDVTHHSFRHYLSFRVNGAQYRRHPNYETKHGMHRLLKDISRHHMEGHDLSRLSTVTSTGSIFNTGLPGYVAILSDEQCHRPTTGRLLKILPLTLDECEDLHPTDVSKTFRLFRNPSYRCSNPRLWQEI